MPEPVTSRRYCVGVAVADRIDELLRLLRRRSDWTTDELAGELDVSRRTVLRDLDRLRDRGFIISGMAGPGGGVRLQPTSVMVTSQLAGDEVVALILAVAIAQASPWVPFVTGAERALAKIEAALPRQRAEEVQEFLGRVLIGDPTATLASDIGRIDPQLVAVLERALVGNHVLRFAYRDAAGRRTTRRVEPHGLLLRAPLWYIIAWDQGRDASRLFRADRINRPSLSGATFAPRPHDLVRGVCPDASALAPPLVASTSEEGPTGSSRRVPSASARTPCPPRARRAHSP